MGSSEATVGKTLAVVAIVHRLRTVSFLANLYTVFDDWKLKILYLNKNKNWVLRATVLNEKRILTTEPFRLQHRVYQCKLPPACIKMFINSLSANNFTININYNKKGKNVFNRHSFYFKTFYKKLFVSISIHDYFRDINKLCITLKISRNNGS